jgi:outer membrane protein OmpA-like peptidoglycan-associated protein
MKRSTLTLAPVALLLLLLGACASNPTQSDTLQQAQQAVSDVENDPNVARYAPIALREAQETLQQANRHARDGDKAPVVEHYAYLALKRAQIAHSQARRESLLQTSENAEQERTRILLESRDRAIADANQALKEAQDQLAELQPKQTERGLMLTLGEVLFSFDSAKLRAGNERSLNRLADYLKAHPDQQILIEGHTDSTGDAAYNERLSEQRAEAVTRALVQRGVDSSRIRTTGLGENYPVADNATPTGRSENRRVEVVIAQDKTPQSRQEMQQATRQ